MKPHNLFNITLSIAVVFSVSTSYYNYSQHQLLKKETDRRFAIDNERIFKALKEIDGIRDMNINATRPLDIELNRQNNIVAARLMALTIDVEKLKGIGAGNSTTNK